MWKRCILKRILSLSQVNGVNDISSDEKDMSSDEACECFPREPFDIVVVNKPMAVVRPSTITLTERAAASEPVKPIVMDELGSADDQLNGESRGKRTRQADRHGRARLSR